MGIVGRLLGQDTKSDHLDDARGLSRLQSISREQTRRELISMALRDTLKKNGLANGCITADALPSFTASKHRGLHVQLIVREWNPSLLSYVVALETAVKCRLERLDPLSSSWITGLSWRFDPVDRAAWPALPAGRDTIDRSGFPSSPERAGPAAPIQKLLEDRDEAFVPTPHAANGFSPTLPMADGR